MPQVWEGIQHQCRAQHIGGDYGELAEGKIANILLLDANLELCHIIQKGFLVR